MAHPEARSRTLSQTRPGRAAAEGDYPSRGGLP